MDREHWEVALKEIQFPHLRYNMSKDKIYFIGWYIAVIGRPSNKRVEFKFMKEIKPDCYLSMSEMIAELKIKIPAEPKNINLHLDCFDIRFDYDSFSYKSFVAMSHGVSIKMVGSESTVRLEFKENEILCGPTPIASPFMENMERYAALYVYTDIIQNQLVGDVRAPLLRVVPVKSKYGDTRCVTYEQPSSFVLADLTLRP